MKRRAAAGLVAVLFYAACGPSAEDVLSRTARKLGDIRSGNLAMKVEITSAPGKGQGRVGFELEGPFALPEEGGRLPRADLTYTQVAGDRRAEAGFIAAAGRAFVSVDDQAYELDSAQVEELRLATAGLGAEGLTQIDISDWFTDLSVSDGDEIGGDETHLVSGSLDVVTALNGIARAVRRLGGEMAPPVEALAGANAQQLSAAVSSTSFELYSGKDDDLLRRLSIVIDFAANAPDKVTDALGTLAGAHFELSVEIANPNDPVTVRAPDDALPYSELPAG